MATEISLTHSWVSCGYCKQQSLDEMVCSCVDIIKEFGSTQCSSCDLDYEFLPSIEEYTAGVPVYAYTIYVGYSKMLPTPCSCCSHSYKKYLGELLGHAMDWADYQSQFEHEEEDEIDHAPWG